MAAGVEACSGCGLCLLVCPLWQATRDLRLSPQGRAKALQHGASAAELMDTADACTLCGACEPACPEDIALVDAVLGMRRKVAGTAPAQTALPAQQRPPRAAAPVDIDRYGKGLLVAGRAMADHPGLLQQTLTLFAGELVPAADEGADISRALEAGTAMPETRLQAFLAPLRAAPALVVADGLLLRALRGWLPGTALSSLGEAATRRPPVRQQLRSGDFYVVEPRAYHADRARLVGHYDNLRQATGCTLNWDLQRIAIPTTAASLATRKARQVDARAQARWMLEGQPAERIIVEDPADIAVFRDVTDRPVLHVSQLGAP